jgi:hypothetical protein
MRTLIKIGAVILMLFFPFPVLAQNSKADLSQEKLNIRQNKPLNINLFTCINYLYYKGIGSVGSTFIGANASYPVAPRFSVEFGAALNYSQLTYLPKGLFPENHLTKQGLHATGMTLYTRGNYFVSSRLTLAGTAFKSFSPYESPSVSPYFLNVNRQGMSFELNYRLFENFHVGAQFSFMKSNSPFYPSRLTQPVFDNYYW